MERKFLDMIHLSIVWKCDRIQYIRRKKIFTIFHGGIERLYPTEKR